MPNIFISYRRTDGQNEANGIFEILKEKYGSENLFLDKESLPAGEHFPSYLRQRIFWADVILLIIGPGWRGERSEDGRYRIDQQHDYVRQEVELALFRRGHQDIPVIPIAINGVLINSIEVPFGLEGIRELSGFEINNDNYRGQFDKLIKRLGDISSKKIAPPPVKKIHYSNINVNEFNYAYGALAHQLPKDANIFLRNDDGYWQVDIKCESTPGHNRSWMQLNTEVIRNKPVEAAVGAMMEWYGVNPNQCVIWREGPPRWGLFGKKKPRLEDGEWLRFSGRPVYTSLHQMLQLFADFAFKYQVGIANGYLESGKRIIGNFNIWGYLSSPDERLFGDYLFSLTKSLGDEAYGNHQLYYLPTIPGTCLQYIDTRQEPYLPNIHLIGHVGKDELGYHIVYV